MKSKTKDKTIRGSQKLKQSFVDKQKNKVRKKMHFSFQKQISLIIQVPNSFREIILFKDLASFISAISLVAAEN